MKFAWCGADDAASLVLPGVDLSVGVTALFTRAAFGLAVAAQLSSMAATAASSVFPRVYRVRHVATYLAITTGTNVNVQAKPVTGSCGGSES